MGAIVVREVQGEEILTTAIPLRAYAFGNSPRDAEHDRWMGHLDYLSFCRVLVLFEDGMPLATATSLPITQSVRGRILPGAGVSFVATHPAARRQGYQSRVILRLLEVMRKAGQTVTALYPSRESFYARFGFIAFPNVSIARFPPERLSSVVRQDLAGKVEHMSFSDGFALWRSYLDRIQPEIHGMALADPRFSSQILDRSDTWIALARAEGDIIGAMTYTVDHFGGELRTGDFFAAPGLGRYLLLQWLGRHGEQVNSLVITIPPELRLETWVYDLRPSIGLFDHREYLTPLARIVSVDAMAGLSVGSGAFTVRISDNWCPWNAGTYTFTSEEGHLHVTLGDAADCDLTIEAISALVYGGYDPADFPLRGWGAVSSETAAAMRSMFPPALPFLHERF